MKIWVIEYRYRDSFDTWTKWKEYELGAGESSAKETAERWTFETKDEEYRAVPYVREEPIR
jgi:hypothetical protein